jgi:hypothetical protein
MTREPIELSTGQRNALRTIATYRMTRAKHGWRAPGSPLVFCSMADTLVFKGVAIKRMYSGITRLEATVLGLVALDEADQRRRA